MVMLMLCTFGAIARVADFEYADRRVRTGVAPAEMIPGKWRP